MDFAPCLAWGNADDCGRWGKHSDRPPPNYRLCSPRPTDLQEVLDLDTFLRLSDNSNPGTNDDSAAALALLLGVSGCGLDAYEKEVDKSQKAESKSSTKPISFWATRSSCRPGPASSRASYFPPSGGDGAPARRSADRRLLLPLLPDGSRRLPTAAGKGTPKAGTPPRWRLSKVSLGPSTRPWPRRALPGNVHRLRFRRQEERLSRQDPQAFPTIPNAPQQRKEPRTVTRTLFTTSGPAKIRSSPLRSITFSRTSASATWSPSYSTWGKSRHPCGQECETYSLQSLLLGDEASLVGQSYKERRHRVNRRRCERYACAPDYLLGYGFCQKLSPLRLSGGRVSIVQSPLTCT